MKVNKKHVVLKKSSKEDDSYTNISPADRISIMWDLTLEAWSLGGKINNKQKLQRNVVNLIKKK